MISQLLEALIAILSIDSSIYISARSIPTEEAKEDFKYKFCTFIFKRKKKTRYHYSVIGFNTFLCFIYTIFPLIENINTESSISLG